MDSIKSLFRRSKEQENVIRIAQEKLQQSNTGCASDEDQMRTVIDGFLGYVRALEQEVHTELEAVIAKETDRANEKIQTRLEAAKKDVEYYKKEVQKESGLQLDRALDGFRKEKAILQSLLAVRSGDLERQSKLTAELQSQTFSQNKTIVEQKNNIETLSKNLAVSSSKL
ncbi:MAG: hypothetical protein Q9184_006959 [Pyrenodesmia sp. 2 TL-2023]